MLLENNLLGSAQFFIDDLENLYWTKIKKHLITIEKSHTKR